MWSNAVKIPPIKNMPVLMFCFTSIRWHYSSCIIKPNKNLIILEICKHSHSLPSILALALLLEEMCISRIIGIIRHIYFCSYICFEP